MLGEEVQGFEARQKSEKGEYQVFPSRITYNGTITTEGKEYPAHITFQTKKKCAWRIDTDMTFFMEVEDAIVKMNFMTVTYEKLNGTAAFEQTYSEAAIVPSYDAENGKMFEQSIEKYSVEKTQNGVRLDFKEPEVRSTIGYGDILLTMESDEFMLDMMKRGIGSYSYMLLDADLPQLYSKEDIAFAQYSDTSSFDGIRLWHRKSESLALVDGEWQRTSILTEILDSLGIALYFGFDFPDFGEIKFYLQEVEFLEAEVCPSE